MKASVAVPVHHSGALAFSDVMWATRVEEVVYMLVTWSIIAFLVSSKDISFKSIASCFLSLIVLSVVTFFNLKP